MATDADLDEDELEEAPPGLCSTCGATDWRPIAYGFPADFEALEAAMARDEVEHAGCTVGPDLPRWRCRRCGAGAGELGA